MSVGEMVGLVLAALLLGGVVGGLVTGSLPSHGRWGTGSAGRRIDAYGQWLAARVTLTRASASFVASFKALAVEPRESSFFALRRDEAQRARAAWCDAMRDLDRTEALLIVWSGNPDIRARLASFERVAPEVLRAAINGAPRDAKRMFDRLGTADGQAADFAIQEVGGDRSETFLRHWLRRAVVFLRAIERQWSRS